MIGLLLHRIGVVIFGHLVQSAILVTVCTCCFCVSFVVFLLPALSINRWIEYRNVIIDWNDGRPSVLWYLHRSLSICCGGSGNCPLGASHPLPWFIQTFLGDYLQGWCELLIGNSGRVLATFHFSGVLSQHFPPSDFTCLEKGFLFKKIYVSKNFGSWL